MEFWLIMDNSKYCIEWASEHMLQKHLNMAWRKYSGPYFSFERALQAKKDILKSKPSHLWKYYRIVHYHKENY